MNEADPCPADQPSGLPAVDRLDHARLRRRAAFLRDLANARGLLASRHSIEHTVMVRELLGRGPIAGGR